MTLPRIQSILNPTVASPSIERPRKPAVLDIANLLCPDDDNNEPTPSPYWDASPTSSSARSRLSSSTYDEWAYHHRIQESDQARQHRPTAFRNPSTTTTSYSYSPSPPESYLNRSPSPYQSPSPRYSPSIKAKRKRASAGQLDVLNQVFTQTFFPSTEMRNELAKQLGMSPRTVQIWFQNKRQSIRTRERSLQDKQDDRRYHHSLPTPPLSSAHDGAGGYIDAT
ncbi:unnamed protein product [Umbelopsis vinacea]